jgi:hypothetical protein
MEGAMRVAADIARNAKPPRRRSAPDREDATSLARRRRFRRCRDGSAATWGVGELACQSTTVEYDQEGRGRRSSAKGHPGNSGLLPRQEPMTILYCRW